MRFTALITFITLCSAPLLAACGGDDEESFDNLQDCYDDHHNEESLGITESIVVCCTDHEINGVKPACGATQTTCETFVNAGLDDTVTSAQITTACADYIVQLGS